MTNGHLVDKHLLRSLETPWGAGRLCAHRCSVMYCSQTSGVRRQQVEGQEAAPSGRGPAVLTQRDTRSAHLPGSHAQLRVFPCLLSPPLPF